MSWIERVGMILKKGAGMNKSWSWSKGASKSWSAEKSWSLKKGEGPAQSAEGQADKPPQ